MEIIDILVITAATLIPLSKVWDAVSTILYVGESGEMNLFARWLMHKVGLKAACWLFVAFEAVVAGLLAWPVIARGRVVEEVAYIVFALVVSVFNAAVGHYNTYRRSNAFIRAAFALTTVANAISRRFRR